MTRLLRVLRSLARRSVSTPGAAGQPRQMWLEEPS